jgi:hypothetical protein
MTSTVTAPRMIANPRRVRYATRPWLPQDLNDLAPRQEAEHVGAGDQTGGLAIHQD